MSPVLYPPVYTLRLELLEIEPPIWRRIQVPGSFTLADVHDVIQLVMGWEDSHMHLFEIGGGRYGFGDDWQHVVTVEAVRRDIPRADVPRLLGGERACPPEDCGGVYGYHELLEALADPEHEEHASLRAWLGLCPCRGLRRG